MLFDLTYSRGPVHPCTMERSMLLIDVPRWELSVEPESQVSYIVVTKIFMNFVTFSTRSAYRFLQYTEVRHLGFSEIMLFSVNHREAIVAKLVLSLSDCPSRWYDLGTMMQARGKNKSTQSILGENRPLEKLLTFPHCCFYSQMLSTNCLYMFCLFKMFPLC